MRRVQEDRVTFVSAPHNVILAAPRGRRPSSDNDETCWRKTGPKCNQAMIKACRNVASNAYSCVVQDMYKKNFMCVTLDRCTLPNVGKHGKIVCDTTGAIYMDYYEFKNMTYGGDGAGQHFDDKGTCQFACDDGYVMQQNVPNNYECNAKGFRDYDSGKAITSTPACLITDPCMGDPSPCKNGGKCDDTRGSGAEPYQCRCGQGWAGKNCEYKDPCFTSTAGNKSCTWMLNTGGVRGLKTRLEQ